jgi:hypothetical protein
MAIIATLFPKVTQYFIILFYSRSLNILFLTALFIVIPYWTVIFDLWQFNLNVIFIIY